MSILDQLFSNGDHDSAEHSTGRTHAPSVTLSPEPLARMNLRSLALAALGMQLGEPVPAGLETPEHDYLMRHLRAVNPMESGLDAVVQAYVVSPATEDRPLIRLAHKIGLTCFEMLVIALTAAIEDDVMAGRVLALLQAPIGGSRPTVGLLTSVFAQLVEDQVHPTDLLLTGAAVQSGLLTLLSNGGPLPEQAVSVPLHLTLALRGTDGSVDGTSIGVPAATQVKLPPSIADEAQRQATALVQGMGRALLLRTGSEAEGRAVATAVADSLAKRAVFIETDELSSLGPWLYLRDLIPVFPLALGPGERHRLPALPVYDGPLLAICGPDGTVEAPGESVSSWSIPVPPTEERRWLWHDALHDEHLAETLAQHHRHGCGRIAQLGRLAQHQSVINGHDRPTATDVLAAAWTGEGGGMDALAQPLTDPIPDDALVVTETLRDDLGALLMRCHTRDGLTDGLGASATTRYRPGVRVLLVGPSGTGKTLAVGWLANQLGLPLYSVDLASVTSKYIGETEKNLAQLLTRAEQSEVVLLFDEADSLFGKRTDVQQANDRFANAQTNYLLQRIESYNGIAILTSNSRNRFDSAFARRLDMIIEFPLPGPKERRRLWRSHLGTRHRISAQELNHLSATANLTGGHIRNVVLAAAVPAQAEGRPIEYTDILHGLEREYRKLARQMPASLKQQA